LVFNTYADKGACTAYPFLQDIYQMFQRRSYEIYKETIDNSIPEEAMASYPPPLLALEQEYFGKWSTEFLKI